MKLPSDDQLQLGINKLRRSAVVWTCHGGHQPADAFKLCADYLEYMKRGRRSGKGGGPDE